MKKNNKRYSVYPVLLFCVAVLTGIFCMRQKSAASWIEMEDGTKYEKDDGQYAVGFFDMDGQRFYFDEDGYLKTGKFYVEGDGYYYADKDGVIQTGVIRNKKAFYIADETGKIQTGFVNDGVNSYYFNEDAQLLTGWFKSEENWYYSNEEGIIMTGFLTLDGYRYYLNSDGSRVSDAVMEIDGVTYIFNTDGSVDENATALYPVYQYFTNVRSQMGQPDILMNSKVQACAILRAADLVNGFGTMTEEGLSIEYMLKNRGIKCLGGYEFSYGGIEGYGLERLLQDIKRDVKMTEVLQDTTVTAVGLGSYEKDSVNYYDIVFIIQEDDK